MAAAGRALSRGFSLLELMLVVALLALVAAVTIPFAGPANDLAVERAAGDIAAAIRFARSESVRTGLPHGAGLDLQDQVPDFKQLAVFQVDLAASPFGIAAILHHPVDKNPYDREIDGEGGAVTGPALPFAYETVAGNSRYIHFTGEGQPVLYQDGVPHRLLEVGLTVGDGRTARKVNVDPVGGRVSVAVP